MSGNENPRKFNKSMLAFIVLACAVAGFMVATMSQQKASTTEDVKYSVFMDDLKSNKIASALIVPGSAGANGKISYSRMKDAKGDSASAKSVDDTVVYRTTYDTNGFNPTEAFEANDVEFEIMNSRSGNYGMLIILAVVAFIVIMLLFTRGRGATARAASGAPGRMVEAGEVLVTFRDVAGCDEVVDELSEIKGFLADPERFRKLGASIPKGVLLFGPPGTGKTLLARAVAGEAGVPFFSISGSDFVEMYVGVGASRVRKLFEQAKQQAPCVIFIDEIDAVGRRRSGSSQGGQEERENTLNQLLVEIDGFAPTDNVIVIAASNRADILDPALTRPGRFDRQVIVDTPDRNGRLAILEVHSKGKPFAKDVDLHHIAVQTAGFCGADLANLVNEAALLAARSERKEICNKDIDEATMRVLAGPQKNRLMTDKEKVMIAAHEMGHALCAHYLEHAEPVHKVTIVSRGRALGLMVSATDEDKLIQTRSELMAQMAVALGGRVAEELCFEDIGTGAANDIDKVNRIAQAMVLKLGMSDKFPLRAFVMDEQLVVHSDNLSQRIDAEVDELVTEAKRMATEVLQKHRAELDRMTSILVERETVDRTAFEALMRGEDFQFPVDIDDAPPVLVEREPSAPVALADATAAVIALPRRDRDADKEPVEEADYLDTSGEIEEEFPQAA